MASLKLPASFKRTPNSYFQRGIGGVSLDAAAKDVQFLPVQLDPHLVRLLFGFVGARFGGTSFGHQQILASAAKLDIFQLLAEPQIAAGGLQAALQHGFCFGPFKVFDVNFRQFGVRVDFAGAGGNVRFQLLGPACVCRE